MRLRMTCAVLFGMLSTFLISTAVSASPSITFQPSLKRVKLGDEFTLNAVISDVEELFGVSFEMQYDGDILDYVGASAGDFMGDDVVFFDMEEDNSVSIAVSMKAGASPASGSGIVAIITFRAKAEGASQISYRQETLSLQSSDGTPISATVVNGSVAVGSEPALSIDPAESQLEPGDEVTLNAVISDVEELFGVSFEMQYDGDILDYVGASAGDFMGDDVVFFDMEEDNSVSIAVSMKAGANPASGSGTIATITFTVKAEGASQVSYRQETLSLQHSDGTPISATVVNGSVTVTAVPTVTNAPPVVSDIPDQTVESGSTFASVTLDDYVSDPDNADSEITWTYSGNAELSVTISDKRIATITVPDSEWSGSETIAFTATDPGGLSDSDSATFTAEALIMLGDVNKDGKVRSNDAVLTLRIVAQLMIPDDYQTWAADMNGDGRVRANDATLILRKAAGLTAPGANAITSVGRQITVALSEASGVAGGNTTVQVWINNADMLASGYISIAYNSSVLRATDIASDSDALMVSNAAEPGILHIAFAGTSAMNVRTLARIQFNILADDVSPLVLKNVELYDLDTLPLTLRHLNSEFRSWAMPPEHSALLQNFPNPFNPETWIPYQLKEESEVTIRIYETSGKLVRELDLGYKPAGVYTIPDRAAYWDGKDKFGINMASGLYFATIKAGGFAFVRKMALLK